MFDYGDGRSHCDTCEEVLHIIRCNALPLTRSGRFDLVHQVLGVPNVMWGMSYKWPKDVGQLLVHPIYNCTPAGHYGPTGLSYLLIIGSP